MVRRHTRGTDRMHYGPALHTVSGNYVAAKRKGVVDGVDYGFTGAVRTCVVLPPPHTTGCQRSNAHPNLPHASTHGVAVELEGLPVRVHSGRIMVCTTWLP